jgi:hypothetical protein
MKKLIKSLVLLAVGYCAWLGSDARAIQITIDSVNTSATGYTLSGGSGGDKNAGYSGSITSAGATTPDALNASVSGATRFIATVGADRGGATKDGTAVAEVRTDYTVNFTVTPTYSCSMYNVKVDSSILGMCGAQDDNTGIGGNGVAYITAVSGYWNGSGTADSSLGINCSASQNGTSSSTAVGTQFAGNNSLTVGPLSGTQALKVRFTWTEHADSPQNATGGDKEGVRCGIVPNLNGGSCINETDNYPGTPSRTQANDGHFVTISAIVQSAPPTVSVNSPATCEGGSATITATPSGGTGPFSYNWNTRPSGVPDPGNVQSFLASVAGPYGVTVTDSKSCTANGSGVLTVHSNPTVTVNSPTTCPGTSATITATPSGGSGSYTTYTWTVPPGASNPGNLASFLASVAGTYSVVVTDSHGCQSPSGSGTLTLSDTAPPSITAPADINIDL